MQETTVDEVMLRKSLTDILQLQEQLHNYTLTAIKINNQISNLIGYYNMVEVKDITERELRDGLPWVQTVVKTINTAIETEKDNEALKKDFPTYFELLAELDLLYKQIIKVS